MLCVGSVLIEIVSKPWLIEIVSKPWLMLMVCTVPPPRSFPDVAVKTVAVSENGSVTSFVGRSSLGRSAPRPGLGRHWAGHPWAGQYPDQAWVGTARSGSVVAWQLCAMSG